MATKKAIAVLSIGDQTYEFLTDVEIPDETEEVNEDEDVFADPEEDALDDRRSDMASKIMSLPIGDFFSKGQIESRLTLNWLNDELGDKINA